MPERIEIMRTFLLAIAIGALTLGAVASGDHGNSSPTGPSNSPAPPDGAIVINVVGVNGTQSFSPNQATVTFGPHSRVA